MNLLENPAAYDTMANAVNPYGDGRAAPRGVAAIAELLGVGERWPEFAVACPLPWKNYPGRAFPGWSAGRARLTLNQD